MELDFDGEVFIVRCRFQENYKLEALDMRWSKPKKHWRVYNSRLNREILRKIQFKYFSESAEKVLFSADDSPELDLKPIMFTEPRPFQTPALNKMISLKYCALFAPVGSGKSKIGVDVLQSLFLANKVDKILIVGLVSIIENWKDELRKHWVNNDPPFDNIWITGIESYSAGKLAGEVEQWVDDRTVVLVDECFTPDMEILTDSGFIRFDQLPKDKKIAQYNEKSGSISFVNPTRYIENDYDGIVYDFNGENGCDMSVTGNHDLLIAWPPFPKKKPGFCETKKIKPTDYKPEYKKYFIKAGLGIGPDVHLSDIEAIQIAIQADGHIMASGLVRFMFAKERKQKRIEDLLNRSGQEWYNTKPRRMNGDPDYAKVYCFHPSFKATKDLWEIFDISSISYTKAAAIINEMALWDGGTCSTHPHNLVFSTTDLKQADFYQAVATLAGYRSKIRMIKAKSEKYNPQYVLSINKNRDKAECQRIFKTERQYMGKVYCVEVPTGNIVVRRNGKVVITGNSSKIKNSKAIRTEKIHNIGKKAGYRYIMTGSSVLNGEIDLYSQFNFLDEDIVGISTLIGFKKRYCIYGGFEKEIGGRKVATKIIGYKRQEELLANLTPYSFVITKEEAMPHLPSQTFSPRSLPATDEQKRLIKKIVDQLKTEVINDRGEVMEKRIKNVLTKILRISQVAGGFLEDGTRIKGANPKLEAVKDILEDSPDEQLVVFTRYVPELLLLGEQIKDSTIIYGGVDREERHKRVQAFQRGEIRVIVSQYKVGALGLNMDSARMCSHFSLDFDLENWIQSVGRIARTTQTRPMVYFPLILKGSADAMMYRSLQGKESISKAVERALMTGDVEELF